MCKTEYANGGAKLHPPPDRVKAIGRGKKKFSNKFQFMLKDLPFVV